MNSGDVLPREPIDPLLDPLDSVAVTRKLETLPASILLYGLLSSNHGKALEVLQHRLEHAWQPEEALTETDYERIFVSEGPANVEEEELKHVVELRGSLMLLTSSLVEYPTIPPHFLQSFWTNAGSGSEENNLHYVAERQRYVDAVLGWGKSQPHFDPLFEADDRTRPQIQAVAERFTSLLDFYRVNQEVMLDRITVIRELRHLLDPEVPLPRYIEDRIGEQGSTSPA